MTSMHNYLHKEEPPGSNHIWRPASLKLNSPILEHLENKLPRISPSLSGSGWRLMELRCLCLSVRAGLVSMNGISLLSQMDFIWSELVWLWGPRTATTPLDKTTMNHFTTVYISDKQKILNLDMLLFQPQKSYLEEFSE